jgi:site-specific recombinase XerD
MDVFASNPAGPDALSAVPAGGVLPPARHPAFVYLASLSPGSRRTMAGALKTIAEIAIGVGDLAAMPWHHLDFAHTTAIRSLLAEAYAPATANRMLAAMRGCLKMAFRLGLIGADQMTRATSVDPVRGSRVPRGRAVSQGELRALFGICDPKAAGGARDAALLGLLYAAGLRRAEVVGLDLAHLDVHTGALTVEGKGRKQRRVYITNGALDALTGWLEHRGSQPGPLLLPVLKSGRLKRRRMTDGAVAERVMYLALKAGVAALSPHDFRRSFVGDMLDAGADIATVQQMAGHASPTTTSRYDRRGERAKMRAAGLLHVPFGR